MTDIIAYWVTMTFSIVPQASIVCLGLALLIQKYIYNASDGAYKCRVVTTVYDYLDNSVESRLNFRRSLGGVLVFILSILYIAVTLIVYFLALCIHSGDASVILNGLHSISLSTSGGVAYVLTGIFATLVIHNSIKFIFKCIAWSKAIDKKLEEK